jgi:hypothetical protein
VLSSSRSTTLVGLKFSRSKVIDIYSAFFPMPSHLAPHWWLISSCTRTRKQFEFWIISSLEIQISDIQNWTFLTFHFWHFWQIIFFYSSIWSDKIFSDIMFLTFQFRWFWNLIFWQNVATPIFNRLKYARNFTQLVQCKIKLEKYAWHGYHFLFCKNRNFHFDVWLILQ